MKIENSKKVEVEDKTYIVLSSYTLRKTIGILGMILPLILYLGVWQFSNYPFLHHSVSQYCYTYMGDVFVGTIAILGVFLITYRGPEVWDTWLTNIAGGLIILVSIFPTPGGKSHWPNDSFIIDPNKYNFEFDILNIPIDIHNYSAFLFFILISVLSFFFFSKSVKDGIWRKWIYKACGIVMFLSCIIILVAFLNEKDDSDAETLGISHAIFWFEVVALEAFGIAWFTKGLDYRPKIDYSMAKDE